MKSRIFKWIGLLLLVPLLIMVVSGCSPIIGDTAGIGTGSIKGFLYSEDGGPLPLIEMRVQASNDSMINSGSIKEKVVYDNTKTRGYYEINDLPEGIYKISFYIREYGEGYTYYFSPSPAPDTNGSSSGSSDSGSTSSSKAVSLRPAGDTGGSDSGDSSGGDTGGSGGSTGGSGGEGHNVYEAYVKRGETYIMPDLYLVKRSKTGYGSLKGIVLSKYGATPISGVLVTVKDKSAVTDSNGQFIISQVEVGEQEVKFQKDGYNSEPATVSILKDQMITEKFFLQPTSAKIIGTVNIEGRYAGLFSSDPEKYIKVTVSPDTLQENEPFQDSTTFVLEVPANQPKYIVNVKGLEPYFSNSINFIVPTLRPGEIYRIPDEAIQFEYSHKSVIIEASTPDTPPGNVVVYCVVSMDGTIVDSFKMIPYGTYGFRTIVDLPYGVYTFKTNGVASFTDKWSDAEEVTYSIDDTTTKVLMHIEKN